MTIRSDDFERESLGSNWGAVPNMGAGSLANGRYYGSGVANYWAADAFEDDQWSEVVIHQPGSEDGDVGAAVRINSTTGEYYHCAVYPGGSGLGAYLSLHTSGGGWSAIGDPALLGSVADGDRLQLRVVGSTLSVYLNGLLILQETDTSLASGQPGVDAWSTTDNLTIESWTGGNVSDVIAISDDFERADGPIGLDWKQLGNLEIVSGEVVTTGGSSSIDLAPTRYVCARDHFSEIILGEPSYSASWVSAWVRLSDISAFHGYGILAIPGILRLVYGNGWSTLFEVSRAWTRGDKVRIAASGSNPVNLKVWFNDSDLAINVDDYGYLNTAGEPGIGVCEWDAAAGSIQSWRGGDGDGTPAVIGRARNRLDVIRGRS